ncbi:hybrid sensor histidine kinase/response regulator [Arenibaculum pallidiluteum]|uniref:hybrid sensor histidine kinase/response regulator n=1 Tax=Arenibaculum pallidiluteum TaxID=2812559 RepID=UPI001A9778BD|nr:NahK/ErcS family hybrid sensor histidine kinase/response regulator [Arenibaculum pallidiluteum]
MTNRIRVMRPGSLDAEERCRALEAEKAALLEANAKLTRVNRVLMDRVERSMDFQGNAYSLFQTAIVLEEKVRERTSELEETLRRLEQTNRDLSLATEAALTAQTRLAEAIEAVTEGFALFDAEDRLVLCNSRYLQLWHESAEQIRPGVPYAQIARLAVTSGTVLDAYRRPEEWLRERLAQHAQPGTPSVHALSDGRWIQISEHRTRDGGTVGVYTDITAVKQTETRRRERELAEKSALLQATLDSIAQGICVYDRRLELVAWNDRFIELLDLPPDLVYRGLRFADLVAHEAAVGRNGDLVVQLVQQRSGMPSALERTLENGTTLEARRAPMPGGGFVLTFSDVTERRRAAAALQEINERLEQRVAERTTELVEMNARLRHAKVEADQANLSKTRFVAAASHDLLQPLNAARLFVAALQEAPLAAEAGRLLENVDASLRSVEGLLDALLDISKLDSGVIEPAISDFRVGTLLRDLKREFAPVAAERGLVLKVQSCSEVVRSDPQLLRRVLQNFLSNALRYTRRGRVLLGCRRRGDTLSFEVWDTGPGIPDEKRDEVFEEFRRLDNHPGGADRGMGLGLAIVRRISRMLGHPVQLRSSIGQGSVFSVAVPRGNRAAAAPEQASAAPRPDLSLAGRVMLVIDNDEQILDGMRALLGRWHCEIVTATGTMGALTALEACGSPLGPDLVIADYHLEGSETGIQAIQSLRARLGRAVPAVLVTADRTAELRDEAEELGLPVLSKPIRPAQLRTVVTKLSAAR